MGFRLLGIIHTMQTLQWSSTTGSQAALKAIDVRKGYFAVYIRETQKEICGSNIILELAFIPRFAKSS